MGSWVMVGGGRARLEQGLRLGGTEEPGTPSEARRSPSRPTLAWPGPGIPPPVGRRSFQKETRKAAHLLAGLGNLKRQTVWSGQLSQSDQTLAEIGPEGRKEVGATERFSAAGESEPPAPVWALALPCSPPLALAAGCLGVP